MEYVLRLYPEKFVLGFACETHIVWSKVTSERPWNSLERPKRDPKALRHMSDREHRESSKIIIVVFPKKQNG